MKYDVFISYSRKDTAIADQICAAFDKAGISYFIDRQELGGGMEFPKVLALAIRESEVFLLLASQNAYDSPFTDREITFAFNKKRGEKMLPYIIDDTAFPEHLELIFSSNNWLMMKSHPIESRLVDDVLRLLGHTKSTIKQNYKSKQTEVDISTIQSTDVIELIPQKKDGKWGFIDRQGKVIIPFEYEDALEFSEGLARVLKNDKFGFIDKQGKIIIPFEYEDALGFSEGLALVQRKDKWGFIDKQGNIVIPFEYEKGWDFSKGLARVKKNGKWGFIDKHGYIVFPFQLDYSWGFLEGLALVEKNGKFGFIDMHGKTIIPFEYENAWSFEHGKAKVTKKRINGISETFYIDKQGNRIN